MLFAADYPFLEIVGTLLVVFAWAIWFWLLIVILTDVFRRHDASGWSKAGWTVLVIVLPFVGVLSYLVVHGQGMAERRERESELRWTRYDEHARAAASTGRGPAEEIAEAKRLLDSGAIDENEYARLKNLAL